SGQITAPTETLSHPTATAGGDGHLRPDAVAIGGGSFQGEGHVVTAPSPVVEEGQWSVLGDDQEVRRPVVVEVGQGEPAADSGGLPGGAGGRRDVGHSPTGEAAQELGRHCVRYARAVVVDVPVGRGEVELAIVVGVEEGDAETEKEPALGGQPDRG